MIPRNKDEVASWLCLSDPTAGCDDVLEDRSTWSASPAPETNATELQLRPKQMEMKEVNLQKKNNQFMMKIQVGLITWKTNS